MNENVKRLIKMSNDADVENFLRLMISKADNELNTNGIDLNFSGTSLSLVLIFKQKLFMTSLGNTRVVMFREVSIEKKYAIELTIDHVPENREERYRIFENGGIV